MAKMLTVTDFFKRFSTDDACLDHLMKIRHGMDCATCGGKMSRVKKRPVYQCPKGHQINPMASTPFERSTTPLQKWFYAMYLFTTTRHGVAAKELQRQLAVTYKTAWRMGHEIRKYLGQVDGDDGLSGHVEIDETYVGGRVKGDYGGVKKTIVMGMIERGGNVITRVVLNTKKPTLVAHILGNVTYGSTVSTDELQSYKKLGQMGYTHGSVNHLQDEYVSGIHHTNNIEGLAF